MPNKKDWKAEFKEQLKPKVIETFDSSRVKGLSTGSTLLNLACSGDPDWGFLPGHFSLLVGDSQSGKTWLLMSLLAEASLNPYYANHRLIHDNPERGALMDQRKYFGDKMFAKLENPSENGSSKTIEQFYDNVAEAIEDGRPFIYGLDSENALTSEDEQNKEKKNRAIRNKGKTREESDDDEQGQSKTKGSYGDGKAKKHSSKLRVAHNGIGDTNSILIVISQTRDNIGPGAMFNPKTRSGGRALSFFATLELWFSIKGTIKKSVMGKDRVIGSILKIQIKKNRVQGRNVAVEIPFYPNVGLDNTGSCVNFLVDEGHWEMTKGRIDAKEFKANCAYENLIHKIESENREQDLKVIVKQVWGEIETACSVERKKRY